METLSHNDAVIRQFTLQAKPFVDCAAHSAEESLEVFFELGGFGASDRLLDSGCGPGIVSRYLAPRVGHVTGVDLTVEMVETAAALSREENVGNVQFGPGDMTALPFPDQAFDGAVSRYAFHHVPEPGHALHEMKRVTRPGGKIVVVDVAPLAAKRLRYDAFERRRDPSHASALTLEEWIAFGEEAGFRSVRMKRFLLPMAVDALLGSSFPEEGLRDELLKELQDDIDCDALGFSVRAVDGVLTVFFPVAAFVWQKEG